MDVRCDRCQTEYEFDDARVGEQGVTVKCSQCGNVFKVKRGGPEVAAAPAPAAAGAAAGAPAAREWKVRQPSGNVFSFRELTTLQKWIVERKVSRDDEISLTGESWKRLGNIAELASFFQVVDEAQRATELKAQLQIHEQLRTSTGTMPAVTLTPTPAPAQPPPAPPPRLPLAEMPAPQVDTARAPPLPVAEPPRPPAPPVRQPIDPVRLTPSAPRPVQSAAREPEPEEVVLPKRGGGLKWVLLFLVAVALAAGGYWLYDQKQETDKREAEQAAQEARAEKEAAAQAAKEAAAKEAAAKEAAAKEAAAKEAAAKEAAAKEPEAPIVDAGRAAEPESPPAGAKAGKGAGAKDFDYWMSHGDKMRMGEKPQVALSAYGKAADMQPGRAEPHAGRGLALLDLGQLLQAEASFQQSLSHNARYSVALLGLAETYKAMGQKDKAVEFYEKFLDVVSKGPEADVARAAIQKLKE